MPEQPFLIVEQLTKAYPTARGPLTVLKDASFTLDQGESLAIVGPSGSGKTTLLGLCAGLDEPSSGSVTIAGQTLNGLSEDERALFRNQNIGFVFQNFQLIPTLTALENVLVPLELRGGAWTEKADIRSKELSIGKNQPNLSSPKEPGTENQRRNRDVNPQSLLSKEEVGIEWLARTGLADRRHHYPIQLSGGEQQRIALARAFVHQPRLLFCDEPTGNLDGDTAHSMIELIFSLVKEHRSTLVLVTHDLELANRCDHLLRLRGGQIVQRSGGVCGRMEEARQQSEGTVQRSERA